ncbi:hypothetical protein D3C85_1462020 [compost metagenome]
MTNVVQHRFGHDLLTVEPAIVTQHLAKPRQVTQSRIQTATSERRADGVHGEIGNLLRA